MSHAPFKNPIGSVRGLIPLHNAKGKPFAWNDLERWTRLDRVVFKTSKIDLFAAGVSDRAVERLFDCAAAWDVRLSLRTDCQTPPVDLVPMKDAGLLDVFLCPSRLSREHVQPWLNACRDAGLPVRVQLPAPFDPVYLGTRDPEPEVVAGRFAEAGVVVVNLALYDPFVIQEPCRDAAHSRMTMDQMNALAAVLDARGIETNLVHVPFCLVPAGLRPNVVNTAQFSLDHQQYERHAYELAVRLFPRGPVWAGKIVMMLLGQYTSFPDPIDRRLLPWLMDYPWVRARIWAWHKLTRHLRLLRGVPKAADTARDSEPSDTVSREARGPVCGQCSLRRICDGATPQVRRMLPGITITAQPGELVVWPLAFAETRRRYYDPLDAARVTHAREAADEALAREANAIVEHRKPDREIDSFAYKAEGVWSRQSAGVVRWYSYTNTEKLSTPLGRLTPPFTLAATFGGGIAEYIGFSFGRHCKLVCPMAAYSHRLVLHVAADGRYVLLRDGLSVPPIEFVGSHYLPARLGNVLEPRISLWNIDGAIGTQAVLIWEGPRRTGPPVHARIEVGFSIVIVSTRYARRLQACLRSIAHQQGFDLGRLEVVVAYVPGLDATDDLIAGIETAHPDLRIVRSTFAPEHANSKGFLINESLSLASGMWAMLLDADIVLPPNMFAAIEASVGPSSSSAISSSAQSLPAFVVPGGRKMLTSETTAKILLGDIEPWRQWQELLDGPGDTRIREAEGVPIGFCQCVRADCFEKVKYQEHHHFEGADWQFAVDIQRQFGPAKRIDGLLVLHLDHGPSNWYGAPRHL